MGHSIVCGILPEAESGTGITQNTAPSAFWCSAFHHFGEAIFDLDLSDTIWLPSRDDDGTMCHERVILFDLVRFRGL
jgi:hypothetical protein